MIAPEASDAGRVAPSSVGPRPPRVLFVQHANPAVYPPIEHAALILAEAGCDVRVIGVALVDQAQMEGHPKIAVELQQPEARGWRQKMAYGRFVRAVLSQVRRFEPDWIYASDALATPAAWAAIVTSGAAAVYHEHDALEPDDTGRSAFMRLVRACRRRFARRARLCVAPSAGRADMLTNDTGRTDIQVVWNMPLVRDVAPLRSETGEEGTKLLFHGSIVPARVPEVLLHALAAVPTRVSLRVTGYDPSGGAYLERLKTVVRELKLGDRIVFEGPARSRSALMRQGAQCDVGVALLPLESESMNERTMLGASNKPFDYMACGLALLVPDLPDWRRVFVEGGFGLACDPSSLDSLVAAIRWFDRHPADRRSMGARGRRQILTAWNYERGFEAVRDQLLAHTSETAARA